MKKLIALILFITHTAFAQTSMPITGTLGNGLDYAILPLHDDKGRIEIRLRVEAGGVDESDTQAGVAHMVEHLVFRASDKHQNGVMNHLHKLGFVRAKHYNAVTTSDSTTYLMTPPQGVGLDDSLSALSQMMFYAHLTQEDLDKERQIITEEWRGTQGVSARLDEQRKAVIRANSRYVRSPVIGTLHSISTMPAHELKSFYQTWYAPNNMNLLIVGDVDVSTAKAKIEEYFGQVPAKPLPKRSDGYHEPALSKGLVMTELHDDKSGVSQVAYILRLSDSGSRGDDDTARKNRLIDRFALTFLTKRLQNETKRLPAGVKSMVVRKSDIGKHTIALGIFSTVEKDKHKEGLQEIFYQIKRLYDYPITQSELDDYKKDFQIQLDKAHAHTGQRDFAGWVQALAGTVLIDKPYITQKTLAQLSQPIVDGLTVSDIQTRVNTWLSAPDQIVQYQAPHTARVAPMSASDIAQMMIRAQTASLAPPTPKANISAITLPDVITNAHISAMTHHGNVRTYTLSTGDRVIWLSHPSAGNQTHIQAVSTAGTNANELSAWQSQIATALVFQNTPYAFAKSAWERFKTTHKLSLTAKQTNHALIITMNAPNEQLNELINLYHAQLYHTSIKDGIDDIKNTLMNELNPTDTHKKIAQQRMDELSRLRQIPTQLPNKDELIHLNAQTLNQTWAKMTQAPTTFYIVSQANAHDLGQLIPRLANPNQHLTAFHHTPMPLAPSATVKFNHSEQRADVQLWTTTPHQWQGVDAMLVSLLKTVASDKLKLKLRDEKLGIYRLSFESTLNPHTNRLESHLKFTTSPDKADEMADYAKQVLKDLPNLITKDDVVKSKANFIAQEKIRQSDPKAWLNRLALSDKYSDDLNYLNQIKMLEKHITLNNLSAIAGKLYNADSTQIWIDTPKP